MIGDLDQGWRRLDVRHLVALECVAREGSFRAAARRLAYSQSAVSEQIAVLEEIVGARLLERPRGVGDVRLTDAGRVLLRHADAVGTSLSAARAEMMALAGQTAPLRVGIFPSASVTLLPAIVSRLRDQYPDLELRLHEALDPRDLLDLVADGTLDLAFAGAPPHPKRIANVILLDDPYVLLVAAFDRLALSESVTPDQLAELSLVDYRSIRPELRPLTQIPGPHRIVLRTDDDATIHSLVAAGIGAAVIPRLSVQPNDRRVAVVAIDPPLAPRRITLAWARARPPVGPLASFVQIAEETAPRA